MIPDRVYQVAIFVLLCAVGAQQVRVANSHTELADARRSHADVAAQIAGLTARSLAATLTTLSAHAKETQENENAYRKLQTAAAASGVSERAAVQRLRDGAATFNRVVTEPGETCPATLERAGDRLAAVGSLATEGDGLLQEARELVRRRDGEVGLLLGQIHADRKAVENLP